MGPDVGLLIRRLLRKMTMKDFVIAKKALKRDSRDLVLRPEVQDVIDNWKRREGLGLYTDEFVEAEVLDDEDE